MDVKRCATIEPRTDIDLCYRQNHEIENEWRKYNKWIESDRIDNLESDGGHHAHD